jgi:hypothetical protein
MFIKGGELCLSDGKRNPFPVESAYPRRYGVRDRDDGWVRHRFAPGEEPTVYTADLCAGSRTLQGN